MTNSAEQLMLPKNLKDGKNIKLSNVYKYVYTKYKLNIKFIIFSL